MFPTWLLIYIGGFFSGYAFCFFVVYQYLKQKNLWRLVR